ncbi:MAG: DUF4230 domain-containing protein [Treponema sp.]|nr:DUF4230 domain-containing protein [Treponema sp.]
MFCAKCGQEFDDGVQFCPKCGAQAADLNRVDPGADDSPAEEELVDEAEVKSETPQSQKKRSGAALFGKLLEKFASLSTIYRVVCLAVLAVVVIVFISILGKLGIFNRGKPKLSVEVSSSLERVLNINELHTVEYIYKSYVVAYERPYYDMDVYNQLNEVADFYTNLKSQLVGGSLEKTASRFLKNTQWISGFTGGSLQYEDLKRWAHAFVDLCSGYENLRVFLDGSREDDMSNLQVLGYGSKQEFVQDFGIESDDSLRWWDLSFRGIVDWCETQSDFMELAKFLALKRAAAESASHKKELYAAAYDGTVIAGINKEITFDVDEDRQTIVVHIPPVGIIESDADVTHVIDRTIFSSATKNNNWMTEAIGLCREDLKKKIQDDKEFLDVARENARSAVEALIKPFEKLSGYKFEIVED